MSSEESFDMPTPREEPDQKVRDWGRLGERLGETARETGEDLERLGETWRETGETCILFTMHIMSVFDPHSH